MKNNFCRKVFDNESFLNNKMSSKKLPTQQLLKEMCLEKTMSEL